MTDDKKTISPDVGTPTEVPEQPNPAPDLADATAPAPLGPEALAVEEQLILEHEGQAALFEMGEAIPDVSEFPGLTIPEQPESDKDNKQTASPGKDDPAPTGKVVDFAAARDEAAKEEKKAAKQNVNRTPSRGQRKNIKFSRPAAIRCWPLFMRRGKACAFPSASGRPDCAGHVLCCNSEYTARSSEQARAC